MINDFSTLSAESDIAHLAQVASNEGEQPIETTCKPMINRAKLVLHNLCVPMEKRIDAAKLQARLDMARARGNLVALHAKIRAEVNGQLQAMRDNEEKLMSL